MARRKRGKARPVDLNAPIIPPIPDVPGPEAKADELVAHYRKVQHVFAIYSYDNLRVVCGWCISDEPLAFTDPGRRGTHKFCSARCAEARAACMTNIWSPPKQKSDPDPLPTDEPVNTLDGVRLTTQGRPPAVGKEPEPDEDQEEA